MFMGRDFTRSRRKRIWLEKAYTMASQRGPEMPKAPKNARPTSRASEASLPVTPGDVTSAAAAIRDSGHRHRMRPELDAERDLRLHLWLKFENLQFTSTFAERGALNRLLALSPEERRRGVIAMSAGNHAQGVAYHANRLGIPASIVMPVGTPMVKIENIAASRCGDDHFRQDAGRGRRVRACAWQGREPHHDPSL